MNRTDEETSRLAKQLEDVDCKRAASMLAECLMDDTINTYGVLESLVAQYLKGSHDMRAGMDLVFSKLTGYMGILSFVSAVTAEEVVDEG